MKLRYYILFLLIALLKPDLGAAQSLKVLFVMSEADTLLLNDGQKKRQTGVFLNEFYLSYKAIIDQGYSVDFATPNGKKATIDQESLDNKYWEENIGLKREALAFWEQDIKFNHPIKLDDVLPSIDQYIGLVIPGGQGLMVDLIYDKNIPVLLGDFSKKGKAIGLICHAPSLITTIAPSENPFIGYKVNSVSPFEELYIERLIMKGKPKNRKIARQLKTLGLSYKKAGPGKSFAVRDRNLVTSQNPYSGKEFNVLFLELLHEIQKI